MKHTTNVILFLLIIIIFIYFQNKINKIQTKRNSPTKDDHHSDYELAVPMGLMQKYMEKLYHSGKAKNWQLASFYLHEIEEQTHDIIKSNVSDDGVNISQLAKAHLTPHIETLENAIKNKNMFISNYKKLLINCNACHISAKHEFIQLIEPANINYKK